MKKKDNTRIDIDAKDLAELIYWARRYCDGRSTYAPSSFNRIYNRIRSDHPDFIRCKDRVDETLQNGGAYWPYAQDGMYDPETGCFEARDKILTRPE